jgi:hypothetical protein
MSFNTHSKTVEDAPIDYEYEQTGGGAVWITFAGLLVLGFIVIFACGWLAKAWGW